MTETDRLGGLRVAIIHHGEHVPLDDGYRPGRMGWLARQLREAGASVTRIAPSFSPFTGTQRPLVWTGEESEEGTIAMVETRPFHSSRSIARIGFIRDLGRGAARIVVDTGPYDVAIIGYPPPGIVTAVHRATNGRLPMLADIRDLWPDALVPTDRPALRSVARLAGGALAQELRLAGGVVAMSETMLERAPASRQRSAIPIGVEDRTAAWEATPIPGDGPLRAVFAGSFSQLFDFDALFEGWRRYVERSARRSPGPTLAVLGGGERLGDVTAAAGRGHGIRYDGWIPATDVPSRLAAADVGVAPTRAGQGTTLSNKVQEYLGAGLHVLHSLEPGPSRTLDELGLARRVAPPTADGWADAFLASESALAELRVERPVRMQRAIEAFGRGHLRQRWFDEIERVVSRAPRSPAEVTPTHDTAPR